MTNDEIMMIMENWQRDITTSDRLVHVSDFTLRPQDIGFFLDVEFYIADNGGKDKSFFGTLNECFTQAVEYLQEERNRLKSLL